jgi:hypothetical protein
MQEEVLDTSAKRFSARASRDYNRFQHKSGLSHDKGILFTPGHMMLSLKLNQISQRS